MFARHRYIHRVIRVDIHSSSSDGAPKYMTATSYPQNQTNILESRKREWGGGREREGGREGESETDRQQIERERELEHFILQGL